MAFTLDSVVPWGRSLGEYIAMFDLTDADLAERRILGCADGPAGFNAEMRARGRRVVSVDPLYAFSAGDIRARIDATYPKVMEQLRKNADDYVWTRIRSPEELGALRLTAMDRFLDDYPRGLEEGRYLPYELPRLPLEDRAFDLALCSHFLFLYTDHLPLEFHLRAVDEMIRVAAEVRVFPLLTLGGRRSPNVEAVCDYLGASGRFFEIRRVNYEFQRGGNEMLRFW